MTATFARIYFTTIDSHKQFREQETKGRILKDITMQEYDVALQGLSLSDEEEGVTPPGGDAGVDDGENDIGEPLEEEVDEPLGTEESEE
mgnify:CR=1 FL=1